MKIVFIGGCMDRKSLSMQQSELQPVIRIPVPIDPVSFLVPSQCSDPFHKFHEYQLKTVRDSGAIYAFYRFTGLPGRHAIQRLLDAYVEPDQQVSADDRAGISLKLKFQPGQRLASHPPGGEFKHYWVDSYDAESDSYLLRINRWHEFTVKCSRISAESNMIADDSIEPDRDR